MFNRIREMLIKEFIQVFRDPRMRGVILILPCIEVLVIGYAVNMDIRDIRAGDLRPGQHARQPRAAFPLSRQRLFRRGGPYRQRPANGRTHAPQPACRSCFASIAASKAIWKAAARLQLQVICDGTDSNTAGIALSYVNGITSDYSRAMLQRRLQQQPAVAELPVRFDFRTRAWFNDNLDSRNYFVPGVIVIVVSLVSVLLTSMAVVREKEIGTIEQIMVTPITPGRVHRSARRCRSCSSPSST